MSEVMTTTSSPDRAESCDALIIGAGFSGMYQLHALRDRLGLKALVLEAGEGVGGTWYWNRYPGARCDSESHSYCYGFSKELLEEWEWSERYPGQPEIMRYLNHVADRFGLKRDIRFNTRVTAAHYDASANRWQVTTEAGQRYSAQYLITAVGCLSTANVPKIPGLEEFAGDWYHTGQWPHEGWISPASGSARSARAPPASRRHRLSPRPPVTSPSSSARPITACRRAMSR
ncbi:flavin-containing monooxygenase [Siccirubricoccus deserti]